MEFRAFGINRWCNESTHACTPTVENGASVPSDSAHASPVLDGTCTAAAATLTCTSGVCDPADNLCGFASGSGSCTSLQPSAVCRSGMCGSSGSCAQNSLAGGGFCDYTAPRDSGNKTWVLLLALAAIFLKYRRRQIA